MKYTISAALLATPLLFISCASNGGGENYDVSNPYATPNDANDAYGAPSQADSTAENVNPSYDAPAVYQDTAPAYTPEAPASRPAMSSAKVHTVVKGDSLWAIGKKYGVSVDSIKAANGLTKDTAVLGAKLQIPAQ